MSWKEYKEIRKAERMEEVKKQLTETSEQLVRLVDVFDQNIPHMSFHVEELRKKVIWLNGYVEGVVWKSKPKITEGEDGTSL